jgi:rRNA maturation RNase YbeY
MIDFVFENVEVPGVNPELFSLWLNSVVVSEGFNCGPITVVFCSDEYLLEMNQKYLDHDYYTDIITFDYSEEDDVSGDLFVSADMVKDNAETIGLDYLEEVKRVCVHGVLHLCGYKDKTAEESREMRDKEDFYLKAYVSRET